MKIKEEIVLSSESCALEYFELKEMRNTERRDRENIKGTEKGQEIAKKSQTGTKESLGGVSLFLKQFWCSYKITNYGENITEREREGTWTRAHPKSIREREGTWQRP